MKRAPVVNFDNTQPITQPTPTPTVAAMRQRVGSVTPGQTIVLNVLGRDVTFTCRVIEAGKVEKATSVWLKNIRLQSLLDENSLSDILPSFRSSGQQIPAFGRNVCGVIEISDGSRRRMSAIITNKSYTVLVGDLTDAEMDYLSSVGNSYQAPSAYERGVYYKKRLHDEFFDNISHLSENINVDRKIIRRCIATATLPIEFIKCFKSPNELSARAGESLSKIYEKMPDQFMAITAEILNLDEKLNTEDIIARFNTLINVPKNVEKRQFGKNITAKYSNGQNVYSLKNAPAELVEKIEGLLQEYSQSKDK